MLLNLLEGETKCSDKMLKYKVRILNKKVVR